MRGRIIHRDQLPLFTIRGNPANPEQMKIDLRVAVLEQLGDVFGIVELEGAGCPVCEGRLQLVLHRHAPTAFCQCGYVLHVDPNELDDLDIEGAST